MHNGLETTSVWLEYAPVHNVHFPLLAVVEITDDVLTSVDLAQRALHLKRIDGADKRNHGCRCFVVHGSLFQLGQHEHS
jgi:hypothetical protein